MSLTLHCGDSVFTIEWSWAEEWRWMLRVAEHGDPRAFAAWYVDEQCGAWWVVPRHNIAALRGYNP